MSFIISMRCSKKTWECRK